MYVKIDSITGGNLANYPKFIFIDYFKHKHWRELALCNNLDENAFEDVLTSVFDDVIDFEKTGFIKSSDELINLDRIKLFLFQTVNGKTDTIKLKYVCTNEECKGEFSIDINLLGFKENKLKKRVENLWLNDSKDIYYTIPSRCVVRDNYYKIIHFKEDIMDMIRKVKEGEEDDEKKKELIKGILEKNYLISLKDNILDISVIHDFEFDNYTNELVALMNFIGGKEFNSLEGYLDFIFNSNTNIYKKLVNYLMEYNVSYDTKVKFKCSHCGKNFEEEVPLSCRFFFM